MSVRRSILHMNGAAGCSAPSEIGILLLALTVIWLRDCKVDTISIKGSQLWCVQIDLQFTGITTIKPCYFSTFCRQTLLLAPLYDHSAFRSRRPALAVVPADSTHSLTGIRKQRQHSDILQHQPGVMPRPQLTSSSTHRQQWHLCRRAWLTLMLRRPVAAAEL